jgi:hypothetical protein
LCARFGDEVDGEEIGEEDFRKNLILEMGLKKII